MLFAGKYERTLDAKNRTVMPPKLKECLDDGKFVLCCLPGEEFIRVYKQSTWDSLAEEHLFADDGVNRTTYQRYMFLNCENCVVDSHGRFLINSNFIERAGIVKDTVIIGVGKRAEIWSKERFEASLADFNSVSPNASTLFPY